jgi:ribosome-associated translation inhibitor RaiA
VKTTPRSYSRRMRIEA